MIGISNRVINIYRIPFTNIRVLKINESDKIGTLILVAILITLAIILASVIIILPTCNICNSIYTNISQQNKLTDKITNSSDVTHYIETQSVLQVTLYVVVLIILATIMIFIIYRLTKRYDSDIVEIKAKRIAIMAVNEDKITSWKSSNEKDDIIAILTQLLIESDDITLSNAREIFRELKKDRENKTVNPPDKGQEN